MEQTYSVYIIYSHSINRYYVGHTDNIDRRLSEHNAGKGNYTSKGCPWIFIKSYSCPSRSEAMLLERKIKSRGIKRYMEENG